MVTDVHTAFDRIPFFRILSEEDRRRLAAYAEIRTLPHGHHLWQDGQPTNEFVFVVRGRMKLVQSHEKGKQTILEIGEAGDLLCASAVCTYSPYCCSSMCMEDGTEVLVVPRRDILELVERNQDVAKAFVREIACRGMAMCQRVEELASGRVEQRIAILLLKLADRAGVAHNAQQVRIPIPLSRQDIADLCATTVETSIRVMSRFRRLGIVDGAARGLLVKDRAALQSIARGDPVPKLEARSA